jgi:hypothetical protein
MTNTQSLTGAGRIRTVGGLSLREAGPMAGTGRAVRTGWRSYFYFPRVRHVAPMS